MTTVDGKIDVDSTFGKLMGFTSDRFRADSSWLWRIGKSVWFSMVWATESNKGYTQALIKAIHDAGYAVKIPTPLGTMNHIVRKMGFKQTVEMTEEGPCEVWVMKP